MPRRGWNEPRRVNSAVPSEIQKERRDRGAAGGQAGSAGQGLPLSNPCRSPAAGRMKLPGCRANETFPEPVRAANEISARFAQRTKSAPGSRSERNQHPFAQRTKPAPVGAMKRRCVSDRPERAYLNGGSLNVRNLRECSLSPSARSSSTAWIPICKCSEIAPS